MIDEESQNRGPMDIPTRKLHEAYRRCIDARENMIHASSLGVDGPSSSLAHAELHSATVAYFEVAYPLIKNNQSTTYYWEEAPVWVADYTVVEGRSGNVDVEPQWECGLKLVAEWYHQQRETVETVSGHMGTRVLKRNIPERLDIPVLFRIGRYLDEALAELGHLPDVKTPVADPSEAIV